MSRPGVSHSDEFQRRLLVVREQFSGSGVSIAEWARERGFSISLTQAIVAGKRACAYGASHRIAVALGLKDELPPPGLPVSRSAEIRR